MFNSTRGENVHPEIEVESKMRDALKIHHAQT